MNNCTNNPKRAAYAVCLVAMRILGRFDGRLLGLLGAVTAAATTVGLSA